MSPSALSHAVRGLEERLGVRLLNRTTRSVRLSAAGERLFASLHPALADIASAIETVNAFRDTPRGTVRVNVSRAAARLILAPVIARFIAAYPAIHLEIATDDRLIDIVAGGFDAGIRFGERIAQDMVAVRVSRDVRFSVVGAPDYFAQRPPPQTPHDLRAHACIRYRFASGALYAWELEKDGVELEVDVDGPLTLDDQMLMLDAALGGAGLAFVFEAYAAQHLDSGRLMRVLADWCPPFPGLFLYYPSRRQLPAGLRALIEMLRVSD